MSRARDSLAALGEPEFRKLFLGQATSVVGSMFRVVALPFAVLAIGGSATDIGVVEAAGLVPLAVLVLVGGVWGDRLPRRSVMLVADLARTALQLTAAALLMSGVAHVWQLAVLQVGMGVSEAFFGPAYTGLVPEVVSSSRLQQANALQGLVSSGSITLGATLAGLLVAAIGAGAALGVDGLSYLVSAAFLWRLRPSRFLGAGAGPRSAAAGQAAPAGAETATAASGQAAFATAETTTAGAGSAPAGPAHALAGEAAAAGDPVTGGGQGFFADLAAGWREFTSHTWIWVTTVGAALFLFAIDGPIQVLGPIVARDAYDGARTWGLTSAAMGIGQIAGGVLSLRWRPRRPMLVIAAGMSVTALPVAFLAVEAPVWTLYASLALVGVEWGLYDPFWLTCLQREVAPDLISRVSAYDYFGVLAFYPAGLALAGPLAAAFGRSTVLWVAAGTALVVSAFQLAWPDVRAPHEMGPPPEPAPLTEPATPPAA